MKRIFILSLVLLLSVASLAFAGAKAMSDSALDNVSAGDWVVLTDAKGNQTVTDVYATNNTLDLLSTSQKDIQAVSNANTIDSAIDVQANVARVSGTTPSNNVEVNGTNIANITNYRPAASENDTFATTHTTDSMVSGFLKTENSKSLDVNSSESASFGAASASAEAEAFNLLETNNVLGTLAGSDTQVGKTIAVSNIAGNLVENYYKSIVSSESESSSASANAACEKDLTIAAKENCAITAAHSEKASETCTLATSKTTRDSKGVNNHIALMENSQQSIKVVSNLNAVGSGAAVQTNIASNVGVSGAITHVNSATVASGF